MVSPQLFATVFGVIFVAELPDKTALAALVLATRHRPLPVFVGAALALLVQSILAVGAGSLLARLPQRGVHVGAGVVFLGCALLMWFHKPEVEDQPSANEAEVKVGFWRVFSMVFMIVFAAEWGDLNQIGTAAFEAQYHAWLTILLASTTALWAVAGIAVFVGNRARKLFNPALTQKIAAALFAVIGTVLVAGAFRS